MPDLLNLRREAETVARARGHRLGNWQTYHGESRSLANNECQECGMGVQCNSKPLPNQIDLGGEVLALNCRG